jgi:hypothetical protein
MFIGTLLLFEISLPAADTIHHVAGERRGFWQQWYARQSFEHHVDSIAEPPHLAIWLGPAWTTGRTVTLALVAGVAPVASWVAMVPIMLAQVSR